MKDLTTLIGHYLTRDEIIEMAKLYKRLRRDPFDPGTQPACVQFRLDVIKELIGLIDTDNEGPSAHKIDAIRIYFGMYNNQGKPSNSSTTGNPAYANKSSVVLVAIKSGTTPKMEIFLHAPQEKMLAITSVNNGTLCPPDCGDDDGTVRNFVDAGTY